MRNICNSEDILDTRDIDARIYELESTIEDYHTEKNDLADEINDIHAEHPEDESTLRLQELEKELSELDYPEDEIAELETLKKLMEEVRNYTREDGDLIRDSYFEDYARDLVEDIGDIPKDLPGYIVIDWEATSDNLRQVYAGVDYDGVTYLVSCS